MGNETTLDEELAASSPPGRRNPGRLMRRVTLRFRDRRLESAFRTDYFTYHLINIRLAYLVAIVMWIIWGWALRRHLLFDRDLDLLMRYAVFIPLLVIGLVLTFIPGYRRIWVFAMVGTLLSTMIVWVVYVAQVRTMPPDYGYVGLILIGAFGYTLVRLPFVAVAFVSTVALASYLPAGILSGEIAGLKTVLAAFYLLSFGALGSLAAYRQERSARLLFVRERQLDQERARSEGLLLNILPGAIVDRLKARPDGAGSSRIAEQFDEVTVLFVDVVGFTRLAARTSPGELVESLDRLFRRFDGVADRYGLEKIKTVGDSYMAAAGVPLARRDHVQAAADMALAILGEVEGARWPTGEAIRVRIGLASGPAVAGVIGHRKFAYDLWGDTVNLASRLESYGKPGQILVSEATARALEAAKVYRLSRPLFADLKGKGKTQVQLLLGREPATRRGKELPAEPIRSAPR